VQGRRDQLLAVHKNDQALESYYSAVPDPRLQAVYRDVVPSGASSKSFLLALDGWKRQLADMNTALASSDWLVGDELTLADLSSVHVPLRAPAHDRGLVALPSLGVLVRSL
jgi:glutathione S-transferase